MPDWLKDFIATMLLYGKTPAVRAIALALAGMFGKVGVDAAYAGRWADALWPTITLGLTAGLSVAWAAYSRRKLHESAPPSPPLISAPLGQLGKGIEATKPLVTPTDWAAVGKDFESVIGKLPPNPPTKGTP